MIIALLHRRRHMLAAAVALTCLGGAISITLLATINTLAVREPPGAAGTTLVGGAALLIALLATSAITQRLLARIGADLVADLRLDLSLRVMTAEYERIAPKSPLVLSALVQDVGRVGPLVLLGPLLVYNVLLIILCGAYLAYLSVPLFAVLVGVNTFTAALGWLIECRTRLTLVEMRQREEVLFSHFRALGEGKKELSLSAGRARHFVDTQLRPAIADVRDHMYHVHFGWGLVSAVSGILSYGATLAIVAIGQIAMGLPASVTVPFVIGALFLAAPIQFLFQVGPQAAVARASLQHLADIGLELESPLVKVAVPATAPARQWQRLQATALRYNYLTTATGERPRGVGPIDLEIRG